MRLATVTQINPSLRSVCSVCPVQNQGELKGTVSERDKRSQIRIFSQISADFSAKFCTGSGADGVGVKLPIFAVNVAVVCPCPLREEEKSEEKRRKAKKKAKKCVKKEKCVKKGENHSDPIYTNPIKNLPILQTFAFPENCMQHAFRKGRFSQKTAGTRRFSQKTAENLRFSQKTVCPM